MGARKDYKDYVNAEVLENIKKWKVSGQTDEWIYKKIGVGRSKAIEWKKKYSEFTDAFKKGKEELLLDLEQTMYTRAMGFYAEDEEITEDGAGNIIKRVTKKKFIWSDSCLQMALKSLAPDRWNALEKQRVELMKKATEIEAKKLPEFFDNIDEQLEELDD